jgi:hypothetical protein
MENAKLRSFSKAGDRPTAGAIPVEFLIDCIQESQRKELGSFNAKRCEQRTAGDQHFTSLLLRVESLTIISPKNINSMGPLVGPLDGSTVSCP